MDMSRYLDLFVSEARQHLQEAEQEIGKLATPGTAPAAEPLNNLFRHFHSLKGMAASMGFAAISTLSHAVEDLFDEIREDVTRASARGLAELVLEACDTLSGMVQSAADGATSFPAQDDLIAKVKAQIAAFKGAGGSPEGSAAAARTAPASAPPPAATAGTAKPPERPASVFRCRLQVDPEAELPGARAALVLRRLESVGTVLTSTPALADLAAGRFDGTLTVLLSSPEPRGRIAAAVEELLDVSSYGITEEILPTEMSERKGAGVKEAEPSLPSTIRIPTASLDHFLDTLGELITWRGSLGAAVRSKDLAAAATSHERLSRAVDRLREEVMAIRLLPFEHIVPQLNLGVRALTRQTGKKVALQISGTDVALDRAVLEEIVDPLNHLLRNAVDHGIEGPAERMALGKEPTGRLTLAVTRSGDRVGIRLEDDGRGMDGGRILATAIREGFVTPEEGEALSPQEILMLTTIPGFSTAEKTTEISGRGVGMDVVRTRIEKLDGRMWFETRVGVGLIVTLDLPLTVAVIDAFIVESGGSTFAVPSSVAMRTQLVSARSLRETRNGLFLEEASTLVPALRCDDALNLSAGRRPLPFRFPVLMFLDGATRTALAVDAIRERRELVVKPLGSPLDHLREFSGAALLDDGRIVLILDLPNLAHAAAGA